MRKLTNLLAKYCDLDKAARRAKWALAIGTTGWAARWLLIGGFAANAFAGTPDAIIAQNTLIETAMFVIAFGLFTLTKWVGWTYGAIGLAHARTQGKRAHADTHLQ